MTQHNWKPCSQSSVINVEARSMNITTNEQGENYCQQKNRLFGEGRIIEATKQQAQQHRDNLIPKFHVSALSYLRTCEYYEKQIAELQSLLKPRIQKSMYRLGGYICAGNGTIDQGETPQKAFEDYTQRYNRESANVSAE